MDDSTGRTRLDDQLDAALAKYAAAEPRPGLEERILANLRSRERATSRVAGWRWAGALAAAFLVALLVLARVENHNPRHIVRRPNSLPEQIPPRVAANRTPANEARPVAFATLRRVRKHTSTRVAVAAAEPKLDHFPSRQPLSDEELALVRYVHSFPKEATLIAQAQEEFDLETRREMNDAGSENQPSNFVQPER